jgi:hypothetical protein
MCVITSFKGAAKRLADIDLPRIGRMIGVGEDELHAVIDVETSGGGFDDQGRPKMLFEPHVFWRELGEAKRRRAEVQGLAYPKWGTRPYPKDSYPRLMLAIQIDRPAALRSASWGLGQIMGFNHKLAGYASVEDMVADMLDDEDRHLTAMVKFIEASGLDDDLRRIRALNRPSTAADWAPFARVYNGPGYAIHGYHTKLAARHNWWRKIRDTPYDPEIHG